MEPLLLCVTDWHQEWVMSHGNDEHVIRRRNIFFETDMPMFLHIFFDTLKSRKQSVVFPRLCAFGEMGSFFFF